MNLTELIKKNADRQPDHTALVDGDSPVTYRQVWKAIEETASCLGEAGVSAGDRVGLRMPNSAIYIVLTYAIWKCEATVVPIGMELKPREQKEVIDSIRLSTVLEGTEESKGRVLNCETLKTEFSIVNTGIENTLVTTQRDPAFIRFTSGTTGTRKGVVLSCERILERIETANDALNIDEKDVILWVLSMAHHFVVTIILYLSYGATIVIVKEHLAGPMLEAAVRYQATIIYAAAFHYAMLAGEPSGQPLPSLRLALSTTTSCPTDTAMTFRERYGHSIGQAYGIIEVGLACINLDDPESRVESVGKPLPGFTVMLENTGNYSTSGVEQGEVLIRGPGMFDAYFDPWTPAEEAMPDGWFATGDIGRLDDEGFLFLCGRTKEVINVAGLKVFPQEVEGILNLHPAIRESRVLSRQHPRLGEIIVAEVVPDNSGETPQPRGLTDYCQKELASYKIPTTFKMVESLPKTSTGKIRRE